MPKRQMMGTTLDIEDDVLYAAKDLARKEKKTAGQVISELARKGLADHAGLVAIEPESVCGIRPFPGEGRIVSNELLSRFRDEGGY